MDKIPILIVDDDEVDRYVIKRYIKQANLDLVVFEKTNGKEALEFLENYEENSQKYPGEFPPVIIFLDINMPLINGFEFLENFSELRQFVDMQTCVVMMFTSSERDEDIKKALKYDFVKDYLVKGAFTAEQLEGKIKSVTST